jgi:FkbM family methyltransferase
MFKKLQVKIIIALIHLNEALIFYPRLKKIYKNKITNKNTLVIDVGTNKGQTIDFFLKLNKDCIIHGFEPNKELFDFLCIKYKNNSNITLNNCGISNVAGRLLFSETITDETSTFEKLNFDSGYLKMKSKALGIRPEDIIKRTYEVNVMTLSDYLTRQKISYVDVLKIDTEGHEYKCLLGLFPNNDVNIKYIQLEQHNDDMYANKVSHETIKDLLNENNFQFSTIIKHGFGGLEDILYTSSHR